MPKTNDGIYGLNSKVSRAVPNVSAVTSRNLIVATGSNNSSILGFITFFKFGQERNIASRYELGLDEVSYLSPGAIKGDANLIDVKKILVFEGTLLEAFGKSYSEGALLQGADNQGKDGAPQSLLDFNMPFDIYILRRGVDSFTDDKMKTNFALPEPNAGSADFRTMDLNASGLGGRGYSYGGFGSRYQELDKIPTLKDYRGAGQEAYQGEQALIDRQNRNASTQKALLKETAKNSPYGLIIYRAFRECWFTRWTVEIDTGEGKMAPIIEDAQIKYTYMEGRPSNDPDKIHKIVDAAMASGSKDIVAIATAAIGTASSPVGKGGGIGAIPVPQNEKGIQQLKPLVQTPAQIAGMTSNISKSTVEDERYQKAQDEINKRLDIMKGQQTELANLKLNNGDPTRIAYLENALAIGDKQVYQVAQNGGVDSDTLKTTMNNKSVEVGLYTDFYFGGSLDKAYENKIRDVFIKIVATQETVMDDTTKMLKINEYENNVISDAEDGGVCKAKVVSLGKSQNYYNFGPYLNNYIYGSIV